MRRKGTGPLLSVVLALVACLPGCTCGPAAGGSPDAGSDGSLAPDGRPDSHRPDASTPDPPACSPEHPDGACEPGAMCMGGTCYPVLDAERCSPVNPSGLCPHGETCAGGACVEIPYGQECNPFNPDGLCSAWEVCEDGVCSVPRPPDACDASQPGGRCPVGEVCVAGACLAIDPDTACSPARPDGLCPPGYGCDDGGCAPISDPTAPCTPENPGGVCPGAQVCAWGTCVDPDPATACSPEHPQGACEPGLMCDDGVCVTPVAPCSSANPDGLCEGGAVCSSGTCQFLSCDAEHPAGACPNGLVCTGGECLFPPCGPLVPWSGTCPAGEVCAYGECRPLAGEPCSDLAPQGACVEDAKVCDDRAGSDTFGTCVWRCSYDRPAGYCPDGEACYVGVCRPLCPSGLLCGPGQACCDAGEECVDDQYCLPACEPGAARCASTHVCCPSGSECPYGNACLPACESGVRCGADGTLCCASGEECTPDLACAPPCADGRSACGDLAPVCCGATATCLFGSCEEARGACATYLDCEFGEYCEPTVGQCLPVSSGGGSGCQYELPPDLFDPIAEWRWTGIWPDCGPSFDCREGRCAAYCEDASGCVGDCVDHRCACAGDDECDAAAGERCAAGVCVAGGGNCGPLYENVLSVPTVADLDGDLFPEVVFHAYTGSTLQQGILVVLDGRDGGNGTGPGSAPKAVLSSSLDGSLPWFHGTGHQAVANLDDDPALEIVAVAASGLAAVDPWPAGGATGHLLWESTAFPLNRKLDGGAPAVADLDGDGAVEIVMGTAVLDGRTGALLAAPDGTVALDGGGSRYDGGWISVVADVDLDGLPEIVTGNRAWDVARDGPGFTIAPRWESATGVAVPPDYATTITIDDGYSAIGNFLVPASGPDHPEVVNVVDGEIFLFDGGSGALVAGPIPLPSGPGASGLNHGGAPTVADFDGDGRPEIATAGNGCFAVFDLDCLPAPGTTERPTGAPGCETPAVDRCGTHPSMVGVLWDIQAQDFSSSATGSSVFDFNGDGIDEVLYNDECFFRVLEGRDGRLLMEVPNSSRTATEYPIVVDVDGDRQSEILLVANNDQIARDHCLSNFDDDPVFALYPQYDGLTDPGEYCDLVAFPEHARECTVGAAGLVALGDSTSRWVKTRPVWHQHSYHVTDIDADPWTGALSIPAVEPNSWEVHNTYRKNVKGWVPLNAPDLQVASFEADLRTCPVITLRARVVNQGSVGVPAGVPVELYGLWTDPPALVATAATTRPLLPGAGEFVIFRVDPPAGVADDALDFRVVVDGGAADVAECVETNNASEVQDAACQSDPPIALCRVASPPPGATAPLDTVILDGSLSYDPGAPGDPSRIGTYAWEIVDYPAGAWPGDFAPSGNGTSRFSFWLPIAGTYTVRLTAVSVEGEESLDTADARCVIEATPESFIHVQMVWDDPVNDQDLHLLWWDNPSGDRELFADNDCYYANPLPAWHGVYEQDPRLDIDDTHGFGPENINLDRPEPGIYRVYVNYAGNHDDEYDTPPTRVTVRIYLRGILAADLSRTLPSSWWNGGPDMWGLADIFWRPDDTGYVLVLPGDAPGEVGWMCNTDWDAVTGWIVTDCPD